MSDLVFTAGLDDGQFLSGLNRMQRATLETSKSLSKMAGIGGSLLSIGGIFGTLAAGMRAFAKESKEGEMAVGDIGQAVNSLLVQVGKIAAPGIQELAEIMNDHDPNGRWDDPFAPSLTMQRFEKERQARQAALQKEKDLRVQIQRASAPKLLADTADAEHLKALGDMDGYELQRDLNAAVMERAATIDKILEATKELGDDEADSLGRANAMAFAQERYEAAVQAAKQKEMDRWEVQAEMERAAMRMNLSAKEQLRLDDMAAEVDLLRMKGRTDLADMAQTELDYAKRLAEVRRNDALSTSDKADAEEEITRQLEAQKNALNDAALKKYNEVHSVRGIGGESAFGEVRAQVLGGASAAAGGAATAVDAAKKTAGNTGAAVALLREISAKVGGAAVFA